MHLASARNLNVPVSAGANNLKLPTTQPLQWTGGSPLQRPASTVNGINGVGVNGINGLDSQNLTTSVSPTNTPARTSSANGTRQNGVRPGILANGQMPMSPHLQHSPSPISSTLSQSPPRLPVTPTLGLPVTPTLGLPSPSLQHQQPIGNPQTGF